MWSEKCLVNKILSTNNFPFELQVFFFFFFNSFNFFPFISMLGSNGFVDLISDSRFYVRNPGKEIVSYGMRINLELII